ncbi:uncharacterized protein LOC131247037 [Magnolia sinica]|uniref:uncharacterized protein LOC131247037 n=1 Tax=Magnolia sinica TaxID=86752 RepID=UPI0026588D40|nr:uncharacterized protein LOC131247037 [Magnolia sinica]
MIFRKFWQHDPPRFRGEHDPSTAELWRTEVERIFDTMQCPSEQRVLLATFLLQGKAWHWWSSVSRMAGPNFVWILEEFVVRFDQKFFPEHVRDQWAMKFETLVQGDMTVSQYEARFVTLSKFAPYLADNERRRARCFQNGLHPALRSRVVGHYLMTFDQVIHRALVYEEDWAMS